MVPYYGYKRDVGTPDSSAEQYMVSGKAYSRGEVGNLDSGVAIPVAAADVAQLLEAIVSTSLDAR